MKTKTIKSILRRKIQTWLSHIDDAELSKHLEDEGVVVTGGSIASMLLGEKPHDFDVYFRTVDTAKRVAEHYVEKFRANPPTRMMHDGACLPISVVPYTNLRAESAVKIVVKSAGTAGEDGGDYHYFEQDETDEAAEAYVDSATEAAEDATDTKKKPKFRPVFLTANAITLSDKMQLVLRFYGDADSIHSTFDFVHCMQAWDSKTGILYTQPNALESLLAKDLIYQGSYYPICSLVRTRKFIQRGWTITAGQLLKICYQINRLNLDDLDVLEDQLTGVDTAYFLELLDKLRIRREEGKPIDDTYIAILIDRIF